MEADVLVLAFLQRVLIKVGIFPPFCLFFSDSNLNLFFCVNGPVALPSAHDWAVLSYAATYGSDYSSVFIRPHWGSDWAPEQCSFLWKLKTQCSVFTITHTKAGGKILTLTAWCSNVKVFTAFIPFWNVLNICDCLFEGGKRWNKYHL